MEKYTINLPEVLEKLGGNPEILKGLTRTAFLDANSSSRISAIHSLIDGFRKEKRLLEKGFVGDNQMFLICRDPYQSQLTLYIDDVPKKYQDRNLITNFSIKNGEIWFC